MGASFDDVGALWRGEPQAVLDEAGVGMYAVAARG